jgi:YD repeat-containing protein
MAWPYVTLPFGPVNGALIYSTHNSQAWTLANNSLLSPGETTPGLQWTTQTYVAPNVIGSYDWRVTSMTRGAQTWLYSYPSSDSVLGGGSGALIRVQDPLGNVTRHRRAGGMSGGDPTTVEFEYPNLLYKSMDELGNVSTNIYTYSPDVLLTEVQSPEGNKEVVTYDSQANILTSTLHAKPGSGLPNIVRSATYACSFNCNSPATMTDARNNTTSFTYSSTHGGILTETSPADASGLQAVKRYAYLQRYAWVKASGGGYSQASTPIWMLDSEKTCRTTATVSGSCAGGAADEVTISYDYGPNSGPNNLWIRGRIVTVDGVSRRTCYGYDAIGNKISETTPRAGLTSCP